MTFEIVEDIEVVVSGLDRIEVKCTYKEDGDKIKLQLIQDHKIVEQLRVDLAFCFERARGIARRLNRTKIHEFDGLFGNSSDGWEYAIQDKANYLCEKLNLDLEQEYNKYINSILEKSQ